MNAAGEFYLHIVRCVNSMTAAERDIFSFAKQCEKQISRFGKAPGLDVVR